MVSIPSSAVAVMGTLPAHSTMGDNADGRRVQVIPPLPAKEIHNQSMAKSGTNHLVPLEKPQPGLQPVQNVVTSVTTHHQLKSESDNQCIVQGAPTTPNTQQVKSVTYNIKAQRVQPAKNETYITNQSYAQLKRKGPQKLSRLHRLTDSGNLQSQFRIVVMVASPSVWTTTVSGEASQKKQKSLQAQELQVQVSEKISEEISTAILIGRHQSGYFKVCFHSRTHPLH